VLLGLGRVAFLTILERKVLGLTQNRLGPTKTSLWGTIQPLTDGIKLLFKGCLNLNRLILLGLGPSIILCLYIRIWSLIPWTGNLFFCLSTGLVFLLLLSSVAYSVVISSWVSSNSYTKLGMARRVLQSLAYEVAIVTILFSVFVFNKSTSLNSEKLLQVFIILLVWILLLILDCNRAPFDLLEGERELISGFNTEISRIWLIILFLGEYGIIIALCVIGVSLLGFTLNTCVFVVLIVLISRRVFPRLRYDFLIRFLWLEVLPIVFVLICVLNLW